MRKTYEQLANDLMRIATIAHAGVLCGIDDPDALCAIRMFSRDYFNFDRTEEQMKYSAHESMVEASPFFSRKSEKS